MSRLNDFAVMILCHGRAENVPTYPTLRKYGYSGRIIIVCDDEDKDLPNYQAIYPEVEVFSKREVLKYTDPMDNKGDMRCALYARNACFDIAEKLDTYKISIIPFEDCCTIFVPEHPVINPTFEEARKYPTSIIFFDEFEAIAPKRDTYSTVMKRVVPELLAQIQGFEKNENNLIVIAATNRPWDIDPALLRPGRFDTKVYVDLPNLECRKAMFKNYLKKASIFDSCIDYLAENTEKYNGSDVKNVSDGLIRIAIDHEIKGTPNYHLDMNDCRDVLNRIKSYESLPSIIQISSPIRNKILF